MSMKNDIIKYVRLKRFQKHDDTKLEFSPGLNIIIGETDNGKSSIVRAIRWLIENKPSGSKFVQRGCDANAVVEISFGDTIIKRVRGKKDNYYLYNGEKYKAMRKDVPEEIMSVTKMNEINIKKQFPQHFLINDSSGEVARKLNSYIGIEEIDIAQKSINSKITDYKSKIKIYKEDTIDLEKEYEELSFVDSLDILVSNIEKNYNNIEKDEIFLLSCKECVDNIISVIEAIDNQKIVSELSNIVKKLTDEVDYIDDCEIKLDNLKITIKNIKKVKVSIQEYNGVLKYSDQLDNINKQTCVTDDKKLYEISKLIGSIQRIKNEIVKIGDNIKVLTKTFKSTMKEAKECPLCGSTVLEKS